MAGAAPDVAILSIQSSVTYGHVGNSAAVFPLQRLGREVWAIDTVQFSNHPGYGGRTGDLMPPGLVHDLIDGVAARGVLPQCQAVLAGYLGDPAMVDAVLHAVALVRAANAEALVCWDPVIGDSGPGIYVRPGIPEALRDRCLPQSDIVTPNQFELEWLTGQTVQTLPQAKLATAALRRTLRPGGVVLVTSLRVTDTPLDALDMLAVDDVGCHRLRTPLLPIAANGAGDTIAALFLHHYLASRDAGAALAHSGNAVFGLLTCTQRAGLRELAMVQAQQEFVMPTTNFATTPC